MIVLALDPGLTTGWALADEELEAVPAVGEADFEGACHVVEQACRSFGESLQLVVERFIITPATARNSQAPWSLEVIGAARWIASRAGCPPLALRSAASAKSFATDERLKRLGWYFPGKNHATDAARHLLTWRVEHGWRPENL